MASALFPQFWCRFTLIYGRIRTMKHYYILFNVHTDGLAMYRAVKGAGMYAQISPTPRELSVCCGISLLIHEEDIEAIKQLAADQDLQSIGIEGLDNEFNNSRHRYG